MAFWIFMLVMVLLIPLTMIVFGAIFVKRPPAEINSVYGYRTKRSMKNTQTWIFAHHCAGRILFVTGVVITTPSVAAMAFVFHREIDTVGWTGGIVVLVQCVLFCLPIAITESALKTKFDEYGRER